MKQLRWSPLLCLSACAATTSTPANPDRPTPFVVELQAAKSTIVQPTVTVEAPRPTSRETAPYARIFTENQAWTFTAMTSDGPSKVNCRVKEVDTMCDRTASEIECDSEIAVLAGTYVTTGRGMWRVDETHAMLADNEREFARFPESFLDGQGNTVARPYHGGWCSSETANGVTKTICISEDKGFLGGSVVSATQQLFVGDVPR